MGIGFRFDKLGVMEEAPSATNPRAERGSKLTRIRQFTVLENRVGRLQGLLRAFEESAGTDRLAVHRASPHSLWFDHLLGAGYGVGIAPEGWIFVQ